MKTPDEIKKGLELCEADECQEEQDTRCPYAENAFCVTHLFGDALAYITQLEARSHGWISVEDRLPTESDGTVLVCFPDVFPYNSKEHFVNAKHDQRVKTATYSEHSRKWYIGDMASVGSIDPTHWMPLPKMPKEE